MAAGYGRLIPPAQSLPLADQASQKAVELDDSSSEAHVARANALGAAWKWSQADPEFRRAIDLNPNNSNAHYFYAFNYLMPTNHLDQALDQFRLALALDPLASIVKTNYALTLMDAHKYSESREQFDQILERDPNFGPALFYLSQFQATQGQYADAVSNLRKSGPGEGPGARSWSPDAKGYAEFMDAIGTGSLPANAAVAYALAGNRDKAFENLEKAFTDRDDEITAVIRFPAFDTLHSDPRWPALTPQTKPPAVERSLRALSSSSSRAQRGPPAVSRPACRRRGSRFGFGGTGFTQCSSQFVAPASRRLRCLGFCSGAL